MASQLIWPGGSRPAVPGLSDRGVADCPRTRPPISVCKQRCAACLKSSTRTFCTSRSSAAKAAISSSSTNLLGFADLGNWKSGIDLFGDEGQVVCRRLWRLSDSSLRGHFYGGAGTRRHARHLSPSCIWIAPEATRIAELGLWAVLPQGPWKLDGALKSLGPYVAPELLDSGVPGRAAMFALGSLLAEQLKLVSQDKLSPDSKSAQSSLQTICQRAMEKSAGQRPSSMLELIKTQLDAVRVTEAAPAQLARFGQLFELAGDTVPQPVTTSDRSAAEPLPPPPSMKDRRRQDPAKPPEKAAAKDAVGSEKAAPQDKADAADGKPPPAPVTINPRAAFEPNGRQRRVCGDADRRCRCSQAELAGGDGKNKPALPARLRLTRRRPIPITSR